MCLSIVKDKFGKPSSLIQSGWKDFGGAGTSLTFASFQFKGSRDVPLDKWLTAEGGKVKGGADYLAGFHVYEDEVELKKANKMPRLTHVYYRHVHTRGEQDGLKIVVARELYVPSDPDAWPPL
jgi:hypothetical protein